MPLNMICLEDGRDDTSISIGSKLFRYALIGECLPCQEVSVYIQLTLPHISYSRVTEVWESTVKSKLYTYYDIQCPNTRKV